MSREQDDGREAADGELGDAGETVDGGSQAPGRCTEEGCEKPAAVRLHIPWAENRVVCTGHARALGRQDGVVADPLAGAEEEWP